MIIEELVALLGFDIKGEAELARFQSGLQKVHRNTVALGAALGKVAAVAGAAFAAGMGALGKGVLDTGSTFENLKIQLEALEGSSQKAQSALEWIKRFAVDTPLELEGVVRGYTQLRTYGLDPMNGSLLALVDTMAMSGKGQEHLDGIITAVGQAWTKQKLQGEEAMQLLERGVPVWDLLSKALGKTVPEIQKMSEKGKLGRKEIQLLIDAMGKRAVGASEKMSKSLSGITSALSDLWTEFKLRVADSGFFNAIKSQLEAVRDVVTAWSTDGTMDKAASVVSGIFIRLASGIRIAFGRIVQHVRYLSDNFEKVKPYITAIGFGLAALVSAAFPLVAIFAAAALAVDDFLTYLQGGESIIGTLISAITTAVPQILSALNQIIPGSVDAMSGMFSAFSSGDWEGLGRSVAALFIAGLKGIGNLLASVWGLISSSAESNGGWLETGKSIMTGVLAGMKAIASYVVGFWTEIGTQMGAAILSGLQGMAGAIQAWFASLVPDWARGVIGGGTPVNPSNVRRPGVSGHAGPQPGVFGAPDPAAAAGKLSGLAPSNVNQTVTTQVTVNVAGSNASPQEIGNATAGAVGKQSSLKNLYFTSATPAAA